jgi:hypothetical protein
LPLLAALFPLAALLGLYAVLRRSSDRFPRRQALARAFVLWGCLIALSTEASSVIKRLSFGPLLAFWAVITCVTLVLALRRGAVRLLPERTRLGAFGWGIAAILLGTLALALAAPPNTWDSMTYHMSRVAHWVQNGSVAFFPTRCLRELYMAPLAEYAIAHLQVLSGSDRLANLVQWIAQVGSVASVSLVAAQLGAGLGGQRLAAVFAATLPMGILQASGTQTDYTAALWLVLFVAHGLEAVETGATGDALWTGAALGLAVLTKQTGYLYGAPLALWIGLAFLFRHRTRALGPALAAAAAALALNGAYLARCQGLWGSPLGPATHFLPHVASTSEPQTVPLRHWLLARAVKNLSLQMGGPFRSWNGAVEKAMRAADRWRRNRFEALPAGGVKIGLIAEENIAGNPLHLALALVLGGFAVVRRPRERVAALGLALAAGALVFLLVMPWQPFNSRLHLSLFVLAAPLVGAILDGRPRLAATLAAVLLIASLPWLVRGLPRRLVGGDSVFRLSRDTQYFRNDPPREEQMKEQARFIARHGCRSVGLLRKNDSWEYPIHVLAPPGTSFHETAVDNLSRSLPPEPGADREDCVCDLYAGGCRTTMAR